MFHLLASLDVLADVQLVDWSYLNTDMIESLIVSHVENI